MRCFLPLRVTDLSASTPKAFAAGAIAFGDTAALRAALPECDAEQRDYSALLSAGDHSAIHCDQRYPRRVVVAVDAEVRATPGAQLAAEVELAQAVTWDAAAAIFVDEPEAAGAVGAAAQNAEALESLERFDLLWYHPQERHALFAALREAGDLP